MSGELGTGSAAAGAAAVVAAALIGLWLALFFLGHVAGGLIHLLPAIAIALAVWSARRPPSISGRNES